MTSIGAHASTQRASGVIADPLALDMQMLLLTGGWERTLDEYRALLDTNGSSWATLRGASILTARAK